MFYKLSSGTDVAMSTADYRGLVDYGLDEFQSAIANFNQALKLSSSYAAVYRDRGLVRDRLED